MIEKEKGNIAMRLAVTTMIATLAAGALSPAGRAGIPPQEGQEGREIGRTTEKELKVVLTSNFGTVFISRGEPEKMVLVEGGDNRDASSRINVDYAIRNRVGYMDLELGEGEKNREGKKGGFKIEGLNAGDWNLKFTDAVPISFDIELGVGKGNFDLSGLLVKDFNLSTGASEVNLSFAEPNKNCIDNLNIESGVSKFSGKNLCNANFKKFKFQGGVGAYTLDFSGALNNEVDVDVEVGMGVLTIIVPGESGARVFYDKSWISRLECEDDFHASNDNEYITDNYYKVAGRMNIRVDSGLGSIRIRHR